MISITLTTLMECSGWKHMWSRDLHTEHQPPASCHAGRRPTQAGKAGSHRDDRSPSSQLWSRRATGGRRDAMLLSRQHPACQIHGKETANWFVMKDLKFTRHSCWLMGLSRRTWHSTRNISKCTVGCRLYRLFLIFPQLSSASSSGFRSSFRSCCSAWVACLPAWRSGGRHADLTLCSTRVS